MYYEAKWERDYFEKQSQFREPTLWHFCLVLLVGPTLAAITSLVIWVWIATHLPEQIDAYLTYLGG